jgi:prevent-host-death family protein
MGMAGHVTADEAANRLPDLLDRVKQGEEIVIAQGGNAVAKLVPVSRERRRRILGAFKGRVRIADDFNAPLPDHIIDEFER